MEKPAKRTHGKKSRSKRRTAKKHLMRRTHIRWYPKNRPRKRGGAQTFTDEQIESILKSAQNTYPPGVREDLAKKLKKLRLKKKYTSPFSDEVLDASQTEFQAVLRVQAFVKGYTERL